MCLDDTFQIQVIPYAQQGCAARNPKEARPAVRTQIVSLLIQWCGWIGSTQTAKRVQLEYGIR